MSSENERIRKLRHSLDLTLEEFGEKLGVTKVAISNIERGNRSVTDQMRKSICLAYAANIDWLRTGAGDMFLQERSDSLTALLEYLDSTGFTVKEISEVLPDKSDAGTSDMARDEHMFHLTKNGHLISTSESELSKLQDMLNQIVNGFFYRKLVENF